MTQVVLPLKPQSETSKVTFDFISKLAIGETISTATTTAAVWSGADSVPSSLISGAASISGTKVSQMLTGGVAGTVYKLSCTITTSSGQTLTIWGIVPVLVDAV